MNTEEFTSKVKDFFNKGAKASKEAFEKAGDRVQEFSDKSVIRLEKKQLESKLDAKYAEIGKLILESGASVSFSSDGDTEKYSELVQASKNLKENIAEKEESLK